MYMLYCIPCGHHCIVAQDRLQSRTLVTKAWAHSFVLKYNPAVSWLCAKIKQFRHFRVVHHQCAPMCAGYLPWICWLTTLHPSSNLGQQRTSSSMDSCQETFWWHFWGPAFHYAGTGAYLVKAVWNMGLGGSNGYPCIPLKGELRSYKECNQIVGKLLFRDCLVKDSHSMLKHSAHWILSLLWIATVYYPRGLIYSIVFIVHQFWYNWVLRL